MNDAPVDAAHAIELLCDEHRLAAQDCWPVFSNKVNALFDQCAGCLAATIRRFSGQTHWYVRVLASFAPELYEKSNATHEAGHAVAAVLSGHRIKQVTLERHTSDFSVSPGGAVWLDGPFEVPVDGHLAMLWAGQRAGHRWLTLKGLDTPVNLVDINYQGIHDLHEIKEWTSRYDLPPSAGRERADEILDQHWPAVEALAVKLCTEYELPGEWVHDFLTTEFGCSPDD